MSTLRIFPFTFLQNAIMGLPSVKESRLHYYNAGGGNLDC